jgi:hypothetical protein
MKHDSLRVSSRRNESPIAGRRRISAGERTIKSIGKLLGHASRIFVATAGPGPRCRMTAISATSESTVGCP